MATGITPSPGAACCFAPVYFNAGVYSRPGFYYSPAMVINPAVFASQLFLRPRYQHYYFGDYYAANYASAGFYPWFSFNNHQGYDPIYAHQHWQHRQDRAWDQNVQADFQNRRDHADARPPRTLAAQRARAASDAKSPEGTFVVAAPLDRLAISKGSAMRFRPLDKQDRQDLAKQGQDVQNFSRERQQLDGNVTVGTVEKPTRQSPPARATLPKSPIVARSTDQPGNDHTPAKRHVVLKPNLDVEPKPRSIGSSQVGDDAPNRSKIETRPTSKIERVPAPRVEPKPVPPRVEPKPAPPKVDRQPSPAKVERKQETSVGRREPPKRELRVNTPEREPAQPRVEPQGESKEKPTK